MAILSTASFEQFVKREIDKIPGPKKHSSKYTEVVCRFHNDTNPSLGIRTGQFSQRYPPGSYKCLSCGAGGRNWNKLAEAYGLSKIGKDTVIFETQAKVNLDPFAKLLAATSCQTIEDLLKANRMKLVGNWDHKKEWRSFPGQFIAKLGALAVEYRPVGKIKSKPALFFPAYVDGDLVGGIRANLKPSPKGKKKLPSYYNTKGDWSLTQGLWPYDHVLKLIQDRNLKYVLIVEGPRDALRLISLGIPAMCVLGTQTMSKKKASLLAELPIDVVWVMGDGDKAGHEFNRAAKAALSPLIRTRVVKIPLTEDQYDPCSLPNHMLKKLLKAIKS